MFCILRDVHRSAVKVGYSCCVETRHKFWSQTHCVVPGHTCCLTHSLPNPPPHPSGQFWNIDVALEKLNETFDAVLKQNEGALPHYIIHLRPPAPAQARSFVGEMFTKKWDSTPEPCIYVGSNQAGTGRSDLLPLGTIVEGIYSDYIVKGAFDYNYLFTRFESESCSNPDLEA